MRMARRLNYSGLDVQRRGDLFRRDISPAHLTFRDKMLYLRASKKDELALQGKIIPTHIRRKWMRHLGLIDRFGRVTEYARRIYGPDVALRVLPFPAEASAKLSAKTSERNRLRWQIDRERMLAIALANALKGAAAVRGTKFTPERSRRASIALRGRIMGGAGAKGPEHYFAKSYSLLAPDGTHYRGENVLHFVRERPDLFDPEDILMEKGTCRAAKALCSLRPSNKTPKAGWKGWTWYQQCQSE